MNGKWTCACLVLLAGVAWIQTAPGQGRFIEDVRVSRQGNEAEVTIELGCPMRFVADTATTAGALIEIRVSPLEDCRQIGLGAGIASEAYRPMSARLAYLTEIEFESLGLGESLLILGFERPVEYRVVQRGNLRTLQLTVQLDERAEVEGLAAPRIEEPAAAQPAEQALRLPSGRTPLLPQVREPEVLADYMINLQSTRERVAADEVASIAVPPGKQIYLSEITVDGNVWYRLRIGFFASEEDAAMVLDALTERFPRAWIGRADADEVRYASSGSLERGGLLQAGDEARRIAGARGAGLTATPAGQSRSLEQTEIDALLEEARGDLLDGRFDAAIEAYARLLQEAGPHQPEVRELLGVAHEKAGRLGQARAEYQAYLDAYPSAEGVLRVRQRLDGLILSMEVPREPLRAAPQEGRWSVTSGIAQYYRRDVNQFSEDTDEVVSLSALFSDIDLQVRRSCEKVDLMGRITATHLYDLVDDPERRSFDPSRVSYAYLDATSMQGRLAVRSGRQSLHHLGVLGRFDGVHLSYDWAPTRRAHVMAGYPVESTRYSFDSTRRFTGTAVEFLNLNDRWDFGAYATEQTMEGYDDRQAVGIEANYFDDHRTLTSMIEYETGFGELNSVLVLGTWRFDNRITLTAHADFRLSPILTLRNALIGQPVSTLDELLLVWTEDEVRQLARDRTSRSDTVTLGIAMPIAQRFQLNADVTVTEYAPTEESGGVLAIPGTGAQVYYSTSFVGSGLFKGNGVTIVNLRRGEADNFESSQLTWDVRVAVGRSLRINPRLQLASWKGVLDGRVRNTIRSSLRLLFNPPKPYRLELEIGTDRREFSGVGSEVVSTGNFVNLGYRMDF